MRKIPFSFLLLLVFARVATAAVIFFNDRNNFIAAAGPHQIADFDDVPAGTSAPFVSHGVTFAGLLPGYTPNVTNQVVGLGQSFWFPGAGSPPNFLDTSFAFQATFALDMTTVGLDLTCFACDSQPNNSIFVWSLLSASGSVVASGMSIYNFANWNYSFTPFFGLISDTPFRSFTIERVNPAGGHANWFADNLRFGNANVPEPTSLFLFSVGLLVVVLRSRRS